MKIKNQAILFQVLSAAVAFAAMSCPLTYIEQFEYTCDRQGWVTDPQILKTIKVKTLRACASQCDTRKSCKSFRYISKSTNCIMYSKYLDEMQTEYVESSDNYLPGRLYERECWSTDCNVIDACQATLEGNCEGIGGSYYADYAQYACSYGHKAKTYGFDSSTTTLDGSLSACDAARNCLEAYSRDGSYDLHYDIPNKQWICIAFHDQPDFDEYDEDPSIKDQRITRKRYVVRDENVGAGYGFWLSEYDVAH